MNRPDVREILILTVPYAVFAVFYSLVVDETGKGIGAVVAIPAAMAGYRTGWRGGLVAGIAALLVLEVVTAAKGLAVFGFAMYEIAGAGPMIATVAVAVGAGWMSELRTRAIESVAERADAEARLREARVLEIAASALSVGIFRLTREGTIAASGGDATRLCRAWGGPDAWWSAVPCGGPTQHRCEECGQPTELGTTRVAVREPTGTERVFDLVYTGCGHKVGHDDQTVLLARDVTAEAHALEQLANARDLALAASRAKSTFLANMSHELRTPLNGIIGYTEMLQDEIEDSHHQADLGRIHAQGHHLLDIVSDVLDLSKIEAGKMELQHERFAVADLASDVASTVQHLARENNNKFVIHPVDHALVVHGDRNRISQILANLLSNGFKFTSDGMVGLQMFAAGDALVLEVRDTGVGIPPEKHAKLFDEFYQGDDSSTRAHDGTGLGLAICKRLADLMGGVITIDSEVGVGSVFRVRLPLHVERMAATTPQGGPNRAVPDPQSA